MILFIFAIVILGILMGIISNVMYFVRTGDKPFQRFWLGKELLTKPEYILNRVGFTFAVGGIILVFSLRLVSITRNYRGQSVQIAETTSLSEDTVNEAQVAEVVEKILTENIASHQANVFWHTIEGDRIFGISYATTLDPLGQSKEFNSEFKEVIFMSTQGFVQADSQPVIMIVMAHPTDEPLKPDNPPLNEVIVERPFALKWYKGEINDSAFVDSWIIVPLPDRK